MHTTARLRTGYVLQRALVLTVAHLRVHWSEFWSPRAQQTTRNTQFSMASECGQCKSGQGSKFRVRKVLST